ncbi:MAG: VWA domain-containing protein [Candidatus Omnitrophica bacterium]|nr:VWA domain-containing protein [Candidatus Omnitrophota bacterium]
MQLANPWALILCLFIPLLVYLASRFRNRMESSLRFSKGDLVSGIRPTWKIVLGNKLIYLRGIALLLIIVAFARPQSSTSETKVYTEGIDIVLAVDTSSSMRAMDFEIRGRRVERLDVVKDVVSNFVERRPNDRIGIVAFAGYAYTVCPLTLDHDWLEKNLERIHIGMMEDGTAIGSAVSAALNRLKDTETKEKVIILLTDGRNNAGRISPMVAAEAAEALGVRVYTIGAGTKGLAPYPVKDMFGDIVLRPIPVEIDEELLEEIAQMTHGEYFRATDTRSLENIYDRIDKLEKTRMEEVGYNIYNELFNFVLIPGLALLLLEIFLSNTLFRRIP